MALFSYYIGDVRGFWSIATLAECISCDASRLGGATDDEVNSLPTYVDTYLIELECDHRQDLRYQDGFIYSFTLLK